MTFSPSTLKFFVDLLPQVQLSAGDPNFEQMAATVIIARRELQEALAEAQGAEEAAETVVSASS